MRNLNPKNITRKLYTPPETKRTIAPDGEQWRCKSCKRDLFGIWHEGVLHVQYRGRNLIIDGIVRAICRKCGLVNLIDTRLVAVNLKHSGTNGWKGLLPDPSPKALSLLREHNLDPTEVQGTGLGGRVTISDVRTYVGSTDK